MNEWPTHLVGQRQPQLHLPAQLSEGPLLIKGQLQKRRAGGVLPPLVRKLACGGGGSGGRRGRLSGVEGRVNDLTGSGDAKACAGCMQWATPA